ncbi:MAG: EAL domain-containing protein, partial [Gammaproteobacteria bacterium]|nr:EAL domain-containing protein [Gammaproteobacteria bacterium]
LYESNTRSLIVASLIAAMHAYIQSGVISNSILLGWSALFVIAYGARQIISRAYDRQESRDQNASLWLKRFRIATTGCGMIWGVAGYFFYQTDDVTYQFFLIFVLVGVSGGAIAAYAIDAVTAKLFVGALYLFTLPGFIIEGTAFSITMALMLTLYIIYVAMSGVSLANKLLENILLRFATVQQQERLNALSQRQKLHIDLTPMGVIEWDSDFKITSWNAAAAQIFGYISEEALQLHIDSLVPVSEKENIIEMMHSLFQEGEVKKSQRKCLHRNGDIIYCEWYLTPLKNTEGKVIGLATLVQDITELQKSQEEIHYLAYYDLLTNLPNRRLLMDRLQQTLIASKRSKKYAAVLFIDLDNFKNLNDMQGHAAGDLLLQEVAQRLVKAVREKDTISRFGGDEFVLVLQDLGVESSQAIESCRIVADKIIATINLPYTLENRDYRTSSSIGACLFLGEELDSSEILKRADTAMFQAKQAGRNGMKFFDETLQPMIEYRASLESDLRGAEFNVELLPYYQLQVNQSQRIIGAEVLLRWLHPEHGMISPMEFIPIAEESNLINEIGHSVLQHACSQIKAWQAHESTRHLRLSINISARHFSQVDFVEEVAGAIQKFNCPAKLLMLELTESLMLKSVEDIADKMHLLRDVGVSLSLDDFGTGYSSLSVLRRFPLDELKIDRSFVSNILTNRDDAVIMQTIIAMGKNLNLEVIAEGVETLEQMTFLCESGCLNYQGYLYGRPMPIVEFEEQLTLLLQSQNENE